MDKVEERLAELGLELPSVPKPVANFLSYRRAGSLLFLSGQGARSADGKVSAGRLGRGCSLERGRADARQIGLQILATAKEALGTLEAVECIVKLFGMVNAEPDFTDHPKVIDGCSDLLAEVLGEKGKHARSAVGIVSLPSGITVEIEAILLIADGY